MPSSTKWRIYAESNNGGSVIGIAEVEMHTSVGGSDVCTGGTATAGSTFGGYAAGNAVDDDNSTFWDGSAAPPDWWQYEFGSSQDIVEFCVTAPPSGNEGDAPQNFSLQYWDGSDWVTTIWRAAETGWSAGEKRTYSASNPSASKQFWRLYISAIDGYTLCGISEMKMLTADGGVDQCTGGSPTSSSNFSTTYRSTSAFDQDGTTRWSERSSTSGWIGYVFSSAKDVIEFYVQCNSSVTLGDAPKDFEFQYWDGSAWQTTLSYTGVIWEPSEWKVFPPRAEPLYVVF